jgi:hypothetical protein
VQASGDIDWPVAPGTAVQASGDIDWPAAGSDIDWPSSAAV